MSNNSNLHKAKKAKNDEFFTMLSDIEKELSHYREHFSDKVVYCNCDDPTQSNFVKYFQINFDKLNLKKLIATGYKKNCRGVKLVYDGDRNGNRTVDDEEVQVTELEGDGDFRSEECVKLLDEADIVVTNPPFSIFRQYVAQLVKHDKKFLIIGNMNAITYKEIFPLIKDGKLWMGYGFNGNNAYFDVPKDFDYSGYCTGAITEDGRLHFRNVRWFTNMDHNKRHEKLVLTGKYSPEKYPKYDNYDAINVDKVNDIPADYYGIMGVPMSILDNFCPEQFEIVSFRKGKDGKDLVFTRAREREFNHINGFSSEESRPYEEPVDKAYPLKFQFTKDKCKVNGKETYSRIFIRKKPVGENAETPAALNRKRVVPYTRILIRRKPVSENAETAGRSSRRFKMSNNSNLHRAKKAKNDEFFTQLSDIEKELSHYKEHFSDKVVYCNCDDPKWSNFVKYFQINFDQLGLKKLIATGYRKDSRGIKLVYDSDNKDAKVEELEGDGDFRSEECVELLKQADIVVTNPPFSLFREYVAQLVGYGKKFLIIGQTNAITFKEIFPLIKANRLWLGYGFKGGNSYFKIPKSRVDEYDESFCDREKCIVHFRNCSWFTNMDHGKRHEKLVLTEKYDPAKYPKYDNYDAINVDKVNDIPKDWDGVMGVPITFLDKYNPEQFEIVQFRKGEDGRDLAFTVEREREWCRTSGCSYAEFEKKFPPVKMHGPGLMTSGQTKINGKSKYNRILIRRRKPVGENAETPAEVQQALS